MSLVELVIGRYPIPSPSRREYAKIFGIRVEEVVLDLQQNGQEETSSGIDDDTSPKTMAIFELLDYIVNRVGVLFL